MTPVFSEETWAQRREIALTCTSWMELKRKLDTGMDRRVWRKHGVNVACIICRQRPGTELVVGKRASFGMNARDPRFNNQSVQRYVCTTCAPSIPKVIRSRKVTDLMAEGRFEEAGEKLACSTTHGMEAWGFRAKEFASRIQSQQEEFPIPFEEKRNLWEWEEFLRPKPELYEELWKLARDRFSPYRSVRHRFSIESLIQEAERTIRMSVDSGSLISDPKKLGDILKGGLPPEISQ